MTQREIAALACKVLALLALINAFNSLQLVFASPILTPSSAPFGEGMENMAPLAKFIYTLPFFLNLGAAAFLWLGADNLARRMVKEAEPTVAPIVVGREAQTLAFSTLGLFTIIQAIPRLGQMLINLYLLNQQDALTHRDFKGLTAPDFVGVFLQLALGLWLLLGVAGLARWIRTVGMDEPASKADG